MFDRYPLSKVRLAAAGFLLFLAALSAEGPSAWAQASQPPPGSPLRAAILDGLRPMVEAEVGAPLEFVAYEMRALGEWAFVLAAPQRPGGAPIDYRYTRYGVAVAEGFFENQVSALFRQTPAGWLVYGYDLGATDVPWVEWGDFYPVPPAVFP